MLGWALGCLQHQGFHRAVIAIYGCEIGQWKPEWHATSTHTQKKTQRECQEYGARRIISGDSRFFLSNWSMRDNTKQPTPGLTLCLSPPVLQLFPGPHAIFAADKDPPRVGWIGNIVTVNRLGSMGKGCPGYARPGWIASHGAQGPSSWSLFQALVATHELGKGLIGKCGKFCRTCKDGSDGNGWNPMLPFFITPVCYPKWGDPNHRF